MNKLKDYKSILIFSILFLFSYIFVFYYFFEKTNKTNSNLKLIEYIDKMSIENNKINSIVNYKLSISNYDILQDNINNIYKNIEKLDNELHNHNLNNSNTHSKINDIKLILDKKVDYIEYYKSLKAVLNNSIAYLLEVEDYIAENNITQYKDIYKIIKKTTYLYLTETILFNNLEDFRKNVNDIIEAQQVEIDDKNPLLSTFYLGIHFNNVIDKLELLNKDLKNINSVKLEEAINEFNISVMNSIEESKKESDTISIVTLIISTLIFIAFVFYYYKEIKGRVKIVSLSKDLESINQNLEKEVDIRTFKLNEALDEVKAQKDELESTIEYLHQTQNQLVETEKMAALGQLVAGVAHEINTPLGAIKSSGGNITSSIHETLFNLPEVFKYLSTEEEKLFFELINKSMSCQISSLSTREERQLKKDLTQKLDDYEIENTRVLASQLLKLNITTNIEYFDKLIKHEKRELIFNTAYKVSDIIMNTNNINTAVERANKIVFSLKSFARYDHSGKMVKTSIKENIETVLTLYHNQIKQNTNLIREYKELAPIYCYPDELNQIWTNLIHNALQAMDNKGTLTVKIDEDENYQIISIKDSGCGIPDDIKDKIFKPFFTTKPAGEGSGLGLDIIAKIVAKHNGKIELNSKVDVGSEFVVYIPKVYNISEK